VRYSPYAFEMLSRQARRRLVEARRSLDLISQQWDESLNKLKLFVESNRSD
jgi:hypothetical protein